MTRHRVLKFLLYLFISLWNSGLLGKETLKASGKKKQVTYQSSGQQYWKKLSNVLKVVRNDFKFKYLAKAVFKYVSRIKTGIQVYKDLKS